MKTATHYKGVTGFFDTHAHLYDDRFMAEGMTPDDVLLAASEAGVTRILIPADNLESSIKAVDYRNAHDGKHGVTLYASVGFHPHEAKDYTESAEEQLIAMLDPKTRKDNGILAIGEIGLDYYYNLSPRDIQQKVFMRQLEIAYELDIPVIIHERDATGDALNILRGAKERGILRNNPGVLHCCSMSVEAAAEMVRLGFYIGVDGPLTFKNNKKTPEVVRNTPIDRIVIETDSPYLTPEPNRGLMNGPEYVPFVATKLAEVLNRDIEDICRITACNGLRMYEVQ